MCVGWRVAQMKSTIISRYKKRCNYNRFNFLFFHNEGQNFLLKYLYLGGNYNGNCICNANCCDTKLVFVMEIICKPYG